MERERVHRAQRGQDAPQLKLKSGKLMSGLGKGIRGVNNHNHAVIYAEATSNVLGFQQFDPEEGDVGKEDKTCYHDDAQRTRSESSLQVLKLDTTSPHSRAHFVHSASQQPPYNTTGLHWIGSTGLAVGNSECGKSNCSLLYIRGTEKGGMIVLQSLLSSFILLSADPCAKKEQREI